MTTTLAPPPTELSQPAVRVRAAPPLEPPYDDGDQGERRDPRGHPDAHASAAKVRWQAPTLPFEDAVRPTFEWPAKRTRSPRGTRGVHSPVDAGMTAPPSGPGDPARFAGRLAQLTAEVMAGDRPLAQIAPLLSPTVRAVLARRLRFTYRRPEVRQRRRPSDLPARAPVVVLSHPRPGVAEAGVVLHREERSRAYAIRLELRHDRWCCTAMEIV